MIEAAGFDAFEEMVADEVGDLDTLPEEAHPAIGQLIDEIRGRRETITGIIERPNRRTRIADEEDMWRDGDER